MQSVDLRVVFVYVCTRVLCKYLMSLCVSQASVFVCMRICEYVVGHTHKAKLTFVCGVCVWFVCALVCYTSEVGQETESETPVRL